MASVCRYRGDKRRIIFQFSRNERRTIWLGAVPKKVAESICLRVQELNSCRIANVPPPPSLLEWVNGLDEKISNKLVRVGLLQPRVKPPTVSELIERFLKGKHVKPSTAAAYPQTTKSLLAKLGADTRIDLVKPTDAEAWRSSLISDGYAKSTVNKRVIVAKSIFERAVRWGLIPESPFRDLRGGSQSNPERSRYVERSTILMLLPHCSSMEWRAILLLTRMAGLRAPSELQALRWGDIDWEAKMMTVRSPKTEAHEGKAFRLVPVDQVLQPVLSQLRQAAPTDAEHVLPNLARSSNLRTGLLRLLKRVGTPAWPRLYQNLRASCETDWVKDFPEKDVVGWLGHSVAVAREHYIQSRNQHIRMASGEGPWLHAEPSGGCSGSSAAMQPPELLRRTE